MRAYRPKSNIIEIGQCNSLHWKLVQKHSCLLCLVECFPSHYSLMWPCTRIRIKWHKRRETYAHVHQRLKSYSTEIQWGPVLNRLVQSMCLFISLSISNLNYQVQLLFTSVIFLETDVTHKLPFFQMKPEPPRLSFALFPCVTKYVMCLFYSSRISITSVTFHLIKEWVFFPLIMWAVCDVAAIMATVAN